MDEEEEDEEEGKDNQGQGAEVTKARATTATHSGQGQTMSWISVVDFDGDLSKWYLHEAAINAQARDWLEEAAQETRDGLPRWGGVDTSQPPYYGLHTPSRANKQPRDADKDPTQTRRAGRNKDDSTDLLGLKNRKGLC